MRAIFARGIRAISLADTIGIADAGLIRSVVSAAKIENPEIIGAREDFRSCEIGVHLHSTRTTAVEKILAAYNAGCRRFDSAMGGLGGCPFAQDALVGNIPTESVIEAFSKRGIMLPIGSIADVIAQSHQIAIEYN
jgi:hydroxymethylglutaryl-CoA lyase